MCQVATTPGFSILHPGDFLQYCTLECALFQDYGDKLEEPPAKKKKRDGPVRISIPTLKDLHKNLIEEEGQSWEF
jgi:hypothetical protein